MKKLLVVLLAIVVMNGYAKTNETSDLSGISKLKTKWYKLTNHNSELKIEKDCNSNPEVIQILKIENQFFLEHSMGKEIESFEIVKCIARPTINSVEQTFDLELRHPISHQVYQVVVRYTMNHTLWMGLTSPNSTHLFTSEDATSSFASVTKSCE